MNYAFMTFSTPDLSLDEALAVARRFGHDGIEPRVAAGHRHGIELLTSAPARDEIRRKAQDSGVALCCIATSCKYADPIQSTGMAEETLHYIDLAGDVGCPRLRVFGGQIPEGVSREAATDLLVEALGRVAEYAADRGVTVCLETHDDWCHPEHVAAVMRRLDHPSIGVNWDIMHPVRRGDATMDTAFETLQPWIRHLHIHDGGGLGEDWGFRPIGHGVIDHRRALELLHATDYDGYLSGEWINWEPYEVHLPRELESLKRIATAL